MQCPKCNCDTVPIGGVVTYRLRKQIGTIATARRCMGCGFKWCIDEYGVAYYWMSDLSRKDTLREIEFGPLFIFEETEL